MNKADKKYIKRVTEEKAGALYFKDGSVMSVSYYNDLPPVKRGKDYYKNCLFCRDLKITVEDASGETFHVFLIADGNGISYVAVVDFMYKFLKGVPIVYINGNISTRCLRVQVKAHNIDMFKFISDRTNECIQGVNNQLISRVYQ